MAKLNLKPTAGYLLIEPLDKETKTASGIYLPDSAGEKPQKGKVLAVGAPEITEKGTKKPSPVKVGDVVIYKKWGGNEVKIDTKEYLFVKFEDILAIETK
jgi:chaperonin GroES